MARPVCTDINAGEEAWDAQVNTNKDIMVSRPIPIRQVASTTLLTSLYPPASYDACLAVVWDGSPGSQAYLYISDGSAWILSSSQAQIPPKYAMQVRANSSVHLVSPKTPSTLLPSIAPPSSDEFRLDIPSDIDTIVIYQSGAEWSVEAGGGTACAFSSSAPYDMGVPSMAGLPETYRRIVCFRHPADDLWYTMSITNKGTLTTLASPAYTLPTYNVPIISDAQTVKYEHQEDAISQLLVAFSADRTSSLHVSNVTGDIACFVEMYNYTLPEIK